MIYELVRFLADAYLDEERSQEEEQRLFWFTCKHFSERPSRKTTTSLIMVS